MNVFYSSLFVILVLSTKFTPHLANHNVPAIFIFGDSTADVGTNSYLLGSQARADFPFNGIDFPGSIPTGRFSNGFNSADFLAQLMGFTKSPPPFLFLVSQSPHKHRFSGVNFASGGSGLLDITGKSLKVVSMSKQIRQFIVVRENLTSVMNPAVTKRVLSKSIFCISVGSNDILGYFYANSTKPSQQFITILMKRYEAYIKSLYKLGARKFGIISVPPIGCCPSQRLLNPTSGCVEGLNNLALAFHSALQPLMRDLRSALKEMEYSLGNTYEMTINVIQNPTQFYFTDVETACCGRGRLNAELPCNATAAAELCVDRNKYMFWDMFHPTQAASKLAAETLYGGGPRFVAPVNFCQLAGSCQTTTV